MGDIKLTYIGVGGSMDVTELLTGMPQNLPKDEALQMTNFDKWEAFWNRLAEVPLLSEREYGKENK